MTRKSKKTHWLLRGVQLAVVVFIVYKAILHQTAGEGTNASIDALCPFGAIETAWRLITTGNYVQRIYVSSMVLGIGLLRGPPPIISAREAARDLGFEPVLPGYLPEGYRLLGVCISRRESGLAHILFYNGVGDFPVRAAHSLVGPFQQQAKPRRSRRRGLRSARGIKPRSGHSLGGKRDQAHPCGGCARGGTAQDGKVL